LGPELCVYVNNMGPELCVYVNNMAVNGC